MSMPNNKTRKGSNALYRKRSRTKRRSMGKKYGRGKMGRNKRRMTW